MSLLTFSRVLRGGKSPEHRFETREVSSQVNAHQNTLDFRFSLPATEGQVTPVRLQIGLHDLKQMLQEVASTVPEYAACFAECTTIAINVGRQRSLPAQESP